VEDLNPGGAVTVGKTKGKNLDLSAQLIRFIGHRKEIQS